MALPTGKSLLNESDERTYRDVTGTPSIVELTTHRLFSLHPKEYSSHPLWLPPYSVYLSLLLYSKLNFWHKSCLDFWKPHIHSQMPRLYFLSEDPRKLRHADISLEEKRSLFPSWLICSCGLAVYTSLFSSTDSPTFPFLRPFEILIWRDYIHLLIFRITVCFVVLKCEVGL